MVQIQGGATMEDKSTAALWFVKNVLYGRFQVLAKARSFSISRFNEAITSSAATGLLNPSKSRCGLCDLLFDSRCKPIYCSKCVKWFHKTTCHRSHRCSSYSSNLLPITRTSSTTTSVSPSTSRASTALNTAVTATIISTGLMAVTTVGHQAVTRLVSPTNTMLGPTTTTSPPASTNSVSSRAITATPTMTPMLTCSSSPSVPSSSSLSSPILSSCLSESHPLNPTAQLFIPSQQISSVPSRTTKKPRETLNVNNFTPGKAEIESLKIELGYAQTKIIDIQAKNKDLQETIKIYSMKLKLLENSRTDTLNAKYFPPSPTLSSPILDCPCQTRASINQISKNLKNLELKFQEVLEKFTSRPQTFCPPSVSVPSTPTATSSPPTSTKILPPPHPGPVTNTDTISQFTFNCSTDIDESLKSHDLHCNEDDTNQESEFSFSDSFVQPTLSPRISLN